MMRLREEAGAELARCSGTAKETPGSMGGSYGVLWMSVKV